MDTAPSTDPANPERNPGTLPDWFWDLPGLARLDPALVARLNALVGDVEVDLDAPLSPDDE